MPKMIGILKTVREKCGDSYNEEVEALGHTEGEMETVKNKSLFFNGLKEKRCSVCGEKLETEVIRSKYPVYYLYILIAGVSVLTMAVVTLLLLRRRKQPAKNDATSKEHTCQKEIA